MDSTILTELRQELFAVNSEFLQQDVGQYRKEKVHCVDRFGRIVQFFHPDDIAAGVDQILAQFLKDLSERNDLLCTSVAFAKFFYSFVSVHPFKDANGRTAIEFLTRRAGAYGYRLEEPYLLRNILFQGIVDEEITTVSLLFTQLLHPLSVAS